MTFTASQVFRLAYRVGRQPPKAIFQTAGGFSASACPRTSPTAVRNRPQDPFLDLPRFSRPAAALPLHSCARRLRCPHSAPRRRRHPLARGRPAVALVWRDPYPVGYNKENDTWMRNNGTRI
jgi:hypothetical protein